MRDTAWTKTRGRHTGRNHKPNVKPNSQTLINYLENKPCKTFFEFNKFSKKISHLEVFC